jgi:hypothetical protein
LILLVKRNPLLLKRHLSQGKGVTRSMEGFKCNFWFIYSELVEEKSNNNTVTQKQSFFTLPRDIKLEIYQNLDADDLIDFHLAAPNLTSELAPLYQLKSNFKYSDDDLWPIIRMNRVPGPIEEDLILAAYDLNLELFVGSLEIFNGISDGLRSKVTEMYMSKQGNSSGRYFLLFQFQSLDFHL